MMGISSRLSHIYFLIFVDDLRGEGEGEGGESGKRGDTAAKETMEWDNTARRKDNLRSDLRGGILLIYVICSQHTLYSVVIHIVSVRKITGQIAFDYDISN